MADSNDFPGLWTATQPGIITYVNVVTPRAFKGKGGKDTGEPKFDLNFETPADSPDLIAAKQLAVSLAKAKWPGREIVPYISKPGYQNPRDALMFPFRKGDELADEAVAEGKEREWSRGRGVIIARSKFRPSLSVVLNGRVSDINKEDEKAVAAASQYFYPGVEALVQFNFVAYDGVGNNPDGVTAYLQHVFSFNRGERVKAGGGTRSASDVFGGYIGITSDTDPTAGQRDSVADLL